MAYINREATSDIDLVQPQREALAQLRNMQIAYDHAANARIAAVTAAREQGIPWRMIADVLGLTTHEVRAQFGAYL